MAEAVMERHDEPPEGVEVFHVPEDYEPEGVEETGWYFWFCQPGCLPDSDAYGSYKSRQAAIDAAWEQVNA